jgi:hypothetical protein
MNAGLKFAPLHPQDPASQFIVEPVDVSSFTSHALSPIRHNLHLHPLLQLPELEKLANFLSERKQCRFVSPDIKLNSKFAHSHNSPDGKTLRDVFERMEEPRSWIALYNVEVHPEYRMLLEMIISSVRAIVEREQRRIFDIGGFIFISAPPAVTPFHIDRENNFWLQVRGRKRLTLFDYRDRDLVSAEAVENFIVSRNLENVTLRDGFASRGREFDAQPGEGVYFPSTTPHMTRTTEEWVVPGNGVSISIGVVFYTDFTRRQAQIHQCNSMLRRFGMRPAAPGSAHWTDMLKARVGHLWGSAKVKFRKYNAPPGSH